MTFEEIVRDIEQFGINLYNFAIYTEASGVRKHRFQPCNNCNDSYSVAKAFVMTAVGLLWDDGLLRMEDRIADIFADVMPEDADPAWKEVTVDHALTHRLGFDEGFLDIDTEDVTAYPTDDYLRIVLSHSLPLGPGTQRQYSDAAYYLLSRVVSRVANENVDSLLWRRILKPMGFGEVAWSRCPNEYPIGATGLYIYAEDMVKLGALYMNGGIWKGKRLISEEWVQLALARQYEFAPLESCALTGKGGMYGQMLMFSKEKGFAAAWHAFDQADGCRKIVSYLNDVEIN